MSLERPSLSLSATTLTLSTLSWESMITSFYFSSLLVKSKASRSICSTPAILLWPISWTSTMISLPNNTRKSMKLSLSPIKDIWKILKKRWRLSVLLSEGKRLSSKSWLRRGFKRLWHRSSNWRKKRKSKTTSRTNTQSQSLLMTYWNPWGKSKRKI